MTDDEIIEIRKTLSRLLSSLKNDFYNGIPLTRERLEAAASKAAGFPVRFPDYDEKTGKVTKVVFVPPVKINYIDVSTVLDEEEE